MSDRSIDPALALLGREPLKTMFPERTIDALYEPDPWANPAPFDAAETLRRTFREIRENSIGRPDDGSPGKPL